MQLSPRRRSSLIPALLGLLGLTLGACSGDDGVAVTESSTAGDTSTSGSGDSDGSTSTSDGTSTSGGSASDSEGGGDGCELCSDDATCDADGSCTCKDGFEGDGYECTDKDECESGKNTCDPDATCTNEPGDYTCTCNEGYKGNGMSCKDIDECSEETDECATNASCTNNDGGYKCTCDEGFEGDGFTCLGDKEFGDECAEADECASGLCIKDTQCTVECSIEQAANDCRDQGYYGLCIYSGSEDFPFICAGDIQTGNDKDDTIVNADDQITRQFQSVSDIDMHLVKIPAGNYQIYATPDPDDDIAVIFYNIDGSLIATQNQGGPGQIEGANVEAGGDPIFALVQNVGNSNGSYTFNVDTI